MQLIMFVHSYHVTSAVRMALDAGGVVYSSASIVRVSLLLLSIFFWSYYINKLLFSHQSHEQTSDGRYGGRGKFTYSSTDMNCHRICRCWGSAIIILAFQNWISVAFNILAISAVGQTNWIFTFPSVYRSVFLLICLSIRIRISVWVLVCLSKGYFDTSSPPFFPCAQRISQMYKKCT